MAVGSLLVPGVSIPQPNTNWISTALGDIGGAINNVRADRSFNGLADLLQSGVAPAQQPSGGLLSRLAGQSPSQTPQTAPVAPVERGSPQGDTYRPFIDTVRSGGLTNPYGLAAVASTGRAESGWSAKNANRTWSDPSESGQPGTAGGIMSWRGPRYQALAATGDLSPEGQARFFLQENPQLIQALNNAGSVEEAQQLMNNAWQFAGYNRPGGESARRLAMAKNYFANEFGKSPVDTGAAAIEAIAPLEQGDTSGTETAYVDPMVKVEPRADAPYTMASPTSPQQRSPMQIADSSGGSNPIAQGVTPVQRGSIDPSIIQYMLRDRNLRDMGLKLWAANAGGQKASEPWQFVNLPDGTLARANQQTGAVESLGNFAKAGKSGGAEYGLAPIYGTDANGNTVIGQLAKDGTFQQTQLPEGFSPTPGISNSDLGTSVITRNNRTGQIIDTQAKDVSGAADQTASGKSQAEARAALPAAQASADQMIATIDSLANDPYLGKMLGPIDSRTPNLTTDAARVQGKMDQIGGQAFLQAFNMLKGGGAITEVEGLKATQAMARLNTAQSEKDYKEALSDLRGIIQRGVENARRKAGFSSPTPTGNQTSTGVQWSIEE